jgi:hypothetical protein
LTRGVPLSWINILTSLRPAENSFTGVYGTSKNNRTLAGKILQLPQIASAFLDYVLTPKASEISNLPALLEGLVMEAGSWGAKQVIAEINLQSDFLRGFSEAGFSIWAEQKIYRIEPPASSAPMPKQRWRIWNSRDISAMRNLYHLSVPALIQPLEPLTLRQSLGLVYYNKAGSLQAYADLVYGPLGIWVLPFVHPRAAVDSSILIGTLVNSLPQTAARPLFITIRSYQSRLETALKNMQPTPQIGPSQALLVKHLAIRQRAVMGFESKPLENGSRETSVPIARLGNGQE